MTAGVIEVLTEALKDKNERVRRRIMATLGELLFYVATQQQVHLFHFWLLSLSCHLLQILPVDAAVLAQSCSQKLAGVCLYLCECIEPATSN